MSLDRIDYEKIQKKVYIVVDDVLDNNSSNIGQAIVIDEWKDSGLITGEQNGIIRRIPEEVFNISECTTGCECLTGQAAEKKFGSGRISCSDYECGYERVKDLLEVAKYCYREISLDECIDTDGGRVYDVKGSAPGCVDQCSEFSNPPVVVKECYTDVVNNDCEVKIDYHYCDSICEDGRCLPPTCDDWIQNQGEEGVDCGGPCDEPCVCPSGCKCVTSIDAENKFGQGKFMGCSDDVCGYEGVKDLNISKYCYKKIESDCIDTDGGADIFEKGYVFENGYTPACEDQCISDRILQECIVDPAIDDCTVYAPHWECDGLCEDGKCLPPSCHDGIQNQDEVAVDCSLKSYTGNADCDSCCNNGIKDYDEEGIDCGGSNCLAPCGYVAFTGRILYEDSDHTTGRYKPVRYGKFYLRLCIFYPFTFPMAHFICTTDSNGYFSFAVPRNGFKSAYIRLGHTDNDDIYQFNYAVNIARDLDGFCDEHVWWHSEHIRIPPTGNIKLGDLRIGMNNNIDFQGYWAEEDDDFLDLAGCYGDDDESGIINGGAAYFNIADAILYARQYANGKRGDDDNIGPADVQYPDSGGSAYYAIWNEIDLGPNDGFEDGVIIHEYAHFLQDMIGTNDDYWWDSNNDFCTADKDEEFAWKEGFAEYFQKKKRKPEEFQSLGFCLIAPYSRIDEGIFTKYMSPESIKDTVKKRVDEYEDPKKDDWYHDWFESTMEVIKINTISWEKVISDIKDADTLSGEELEVFYNFCLKYNRLAADQPKFQLQFL